MSTNVRGNDAAGMIGLHVIILGVCFHESTPVVRGTATWKKTMLMDWHHYMYPSTFAFIVRL